jgi:fatty-acyl-CoA synthase
LRYALAIRNLHSAIQKGAFVGETKFRNIGDIEAFEKIPIEKRLGVFNTYDLIKTGAAINPDAPAISFFLCGDRYDQQLQVSYRDCP